MHETNEDGPLACTQELGAHKGKVSAKKPLPAHAQAHRNFNLYAICLCLPCCRWMAKRRIKVEDPDKFGGDPSQVHATKDHPNLDYWKPRLAPIASHPTSSDFLQQSTLILHQELEGPTVKTCPTPSVSRSRTMTLVNLRGKEPQSGKMPSFICWISELQKREFRKSFLIDDYSSPGSYMNPMKSQSAAPQEMNVLRKTPSYFLMKDRKSTSPLSKLPPSLFRFSYARRDRQECSPYPETPLVLV